MSTAAPAAAAPVLAPSAAAADVVQSAVATTFYVHLHSEHDCECHQRALPTTVQERVPFLPFLAQHPLAAGFSGHSIYSAVALPPC
jgi:hypothetical protein